MYERGSLARESASLIDSLRKERLVRLHIAHGGEIVVGRTIFKCIFVFFFY